MSNYTIGTVHADGVRFNAQHQLRVDRRIENYGERAMRTWTCTCGDFIVTEYDARAKAAYRLHFKANA
jgi:hypothetical protein